MHKEVKFIIQFKDVTMEEAYTVTTIKGKGCHWSCSLGSS
jgi:hypothetical protein